MRLYKLLRRWYRRKRGKYRINVALLTGEFWTPDSVEECLNYEWTIGNRAYKFNVKIITNDDIVNGILNRRKYDLLVVPGLASNFLHYNPFWLRDERWRNSIRRFVADGGGYLGICAGAVIVGQGLMDYDTSNLLNISIEGSSLKLANARVRFDSSFPFFSGYRKIGQSAYAWYKGGGIPLNFSLNSDHPIFKGYHEKTRNIRWIGGPGFEQIGDDVTILANYPLQEISSNSEESKNTRIHAWEWPGTPPGSPWPINILELIEIFLKDPRVKNLWNILTKLTDWDKTDEIVKTNLSRKVAAIATTYKKGRVVAIGPHPEYYTWFGGHVEETKKDTAHDSLSDTFYQWVDYDKKTDKLYNYWIERRAAAWASKVPDTDLPPINNL